jgi:uncharacterized protein (TIGR02646 family)
MRKFTRLAAPEILLQKGAGWGEEWEKRQKEGHEFYWHQVDGVPINQILVPSLRLQTDDHCSFCDQYPVSPPATDTVEHFRPKAKFPREAFNWNNLYYCCNFCQRKGVDFNDDALRPDDPQYRFNRYFIYDYTTGEILPNPAASGPERTRAEATIRLYRLNDRHPSLRRRALLIRSRCPDWDLDGFAYRDYLEPEVA